MAREPRGAFQERARAGHRVTWESERTVTEKLRDCDTKRAPPFPPIDDAIRHFSSGMRAASGSQRRRFSCRTLFAAHAVSARGGDTTRPL